MSVVNPKHLLDQSNALINLASKTKPRQADLRRAVSSAYYAVFHQLLIAVADEFIGKTSRKDKRYSLLYRSIDHRMAKRICEEASRRAPAAKYASFIPAGGFEQDIRRFSSNFIQLQIRRHDADYSPTETLSIVDVLFAIYLAESAVSCLASADGEQRKLFLTLLLFPPR